MNQTSGELLRALRLKRNLSQGKLAKLLGLKSAQYISNIERGVAPIPKLKLYAISKLLKVTPQVFITVIMEEIRLEYELAIK